MTSLGDDNLTAIMFYIGLIPNRKISLVNHQYYHNRNIELFPKKWLHSLWSAICTALSDNFDWPGFLHADIFFFDCSTKILNSLKSKSQLLAC